MLRGLAMFRLPMLEAPVPVGRWLLPGLTPAVAIGAQAAVTEYSSGGAMAASRRLGAGVGRGPNDVVPGGPPSGPAFPATDGVRTSVTLGLRFFGGALGVGAARPTDRSGPWKLRVDFGQII